MEHHSQHGSIHQVDALPENEIMSMDGKIYHHVVLTSSQVFQLAVAMMILLGRYGDRCTDSQRNLFGLLSSLIATEDGAQV